jgi:transcriptional regulator with XRE-family HTH domain
MSNHVGEKVRFLRQQQQITQLELAHMLAASGSHMSNLEAGRKAPSLETIIRLADALRVTTDYLIRDDVAIDEPETYDAQQNPARDAVLQKFTEKLRYLRTRQQLHQSQLAHELGLRTQAHISLLESGGKVPSISLVIRIADFFAVTADYLLRDEIAVGLPNTPGE